MKKILLSIIALLLFASGYSQAPIWNALRKERLDAMPKLERSAIPSGYNAFSLDMEALKAQLITAPLRGSLQSGVILQFPDGDGKLKNFRVYEAPVLHPELGAQHPDIRSYVGQGIEDKGLSIRFSVTLYGLHSMMFSPKGTSYTDPYTTDRQNYIVYKKADLKSPRTFKCGVSSQPDENPVSPPTTQANDGILRTYRLAMACTIEYAAFHIEEAGLEEGTIDEQKAAVLAAMNVTMTRVNGVYERDMALIMQIVPDNEDIIFITSDNLTNNNAETMLGQIQSIINNGIGTANYDIGHVVSTGDGGIASLGSVCSSVKARGVTGNPAPVGDPFDIDYVAHEMGHQFGADHTFNNSFQRSASEAVEPGSGSTIMAYAGISPPNVQNNSDDYFHAVSIAQMFDFVTDEGNCATETDNNNASPVIGLLTSFSIPKGTAFILKGNATDADDDALTYCWEQTNANGAAGTIDDTPEANSTTGPNFRSLLPSASPDRYMPRLADVFNNNLAPTWEVVPTVGRTLNFALTVRDNNLIDGGQTERKNMSVVVKGTAGPFEVTSQSEENISWEQGSMQTVSWNVAGTTANGINTTSVNILLSTDGGQTFATVLAANTPNDGSQDITVPAIDAPFCRIMVEAVDNIYYALNPMTFSIGVEVITTCTTYTNNDAIAIPDGDDEYSASFINVPDAGTITSVNVSVDITHTYISDLILVAVSPQDTQVLLWQLQCGGNNDLDAEFSEEGTAVICGNPTTGTILPQESLSAFEGEEAEGGWVLAFVDIGDDDIGTLNSWSVEVCSLQTAAINSFGLDHFTLYPNPSNGTFTVEFTPSGSNDIAISMHDIRGRRVFGQSYSNTGLFSGNVTTAGLQSGVYIVTVEEGSHKEIKKVVIQ